MGPDGVRRSRVDLDEPSLGSAPTWVPSRDLSTKCLSSLGQIDQYQLVRKLGGGGFGVVYLAKDAVSGVDVALKTLHPLLKANPEEMEALRAKFALVSRLSHPNIATALVLHPCRDIFLTDDESRRELRLSPGDSVMVMRYAPGATLSKWRHQFPDDVVPLDLALEVARQIASALDYAHGEKIVHRDIKPANVMVETLPTEASQPSTNEEGRKTKDEGGGEPTHVTRHPPLATSKIRIRILDFGLAAEIRSSMSRVSTEMGDTSGTRPYMAPEQWLGKKQDGRTDQYALACVLYELLSGAHPSPAFSRPATRPLWNAPLPLDRQRSSKESQRPSTPRCRRRLQKTRRNGLGVAGSSWKDVSRKAVRQVCEGFSTRWRKDRKGTS